MTQTTILAFLLLLAACDDQDSLSFIDKDPHSFHNGLNMAGCDAAGLYTDAYFEKHGKDQILRFKCGGKKKINLHE